MKHLTAILCVLAMTSCTWVKDDIDDCPYGFWIRLHYTYNILDVEAAPEYVTDATIYIYDAQGDYVKRIYATQDALMVNDYAVQVEGLPEGDYQFVVWSGIGHSCYAVSGDTGPIDEFRFSLAQPTAHSAMQLPAVFHGYLPVVHYDDTHAVHDVSLTKNTNQLACLVVPVSNQTILDATDFAMRVVSANATINAFNEVVTETETIYEPLAQEQVTLNDLTYGELHGTKFSIMTLRLMEDIDSRLILQNESTGQTILNLSFTEYVGMIGSYYTNLGRPIPLQEYLDRQDFYTIVFYLSADLNQLIQISVNNWRVRANNHLKL